MAKPPFECELVHPDGRRARVGVEGKTVRIVQLLKGEVVDEAVTAHRFARQAEDAAKLYVWEARQRGFEERVDDATTPSVDSTRDNAVPEMLTIYRVTEAGVTSTYLRDGKRVRSNEAIQEFENEDDAEFALKRMIRPSKGRTITEELASRDEAGLADLPLTDFDDRRVTHFELSEAQGHAKVRLCEAASDPAKYAELVSSLAESELGTAHFFCDIAGSPGDVWTTALGATVLPFRSLIFDTYWETLTRQDHSLGDLSLTLARAPKLERLFASGWVETSPLKHPALSELYLLGDPLDAPVLESLAKSSLPALRKLVLCLRQESADDHDALVLKSLKALNAPALREVYLYGVAQPIKLALQVAQECPSIRALGVEGSFLEEELEALNEEQLTTLSALEVLELDLDGCELPAAVAARLRDVREIDRDRVLPSEYERW